MKQSEFKDFIRLVVPSANKNRVPNAILESLLNKGIRAVNSRVKALIQTKKFDVVDDTGEYVINAVSEISDFVLPGKSGLWFNNGTVGTPNYVQLDSVDRVYLDRHLPNWYNEPSGDNPLYVIFEPNLITVAPNPSSALTDGFLLPGYVYAPTGMSNDDHYPFSGTTTEIAGFEVLDDAIIDYVRWILGFSVGQKQEGIITRETYENSVRVAEKLLKRRPDFTSNRRMRMKVGRVHL